MTVRHQKHFISHGLGKKHWEQIMDDQDWKLKWKNYHHQILFRNLFLGLEEFEQKLQNEVKQNGYEEKQNGHEEKQNGSREDQQNGQNKAENGQKKTHNGPVRVRQVPSVPLDVINLIAEYANKRDCK